MWAESLAAAEYADRRMFRGNLETIEPKSPEMKAWLRHYDEYFNRKRRVAQQFFSQERNSQALN